MKSQSYFCLILLFSLPFLTLEKFICTSDSDCQALLMRNCNTGTLTCIETISMSDSDCDYLGTAGVGRVRTLTFDSVTLRVCTRTCSSHSQCNGNPTAKICKSGECVECLQSADCTAIGFKSHICTNNFCYKPSIALACTTLSACSMPPCHDDGMRCWEKCDESTSCMGSSCINGVLGIVGLCSNRQSTPPSIITCVAIGNCPATFPVCDSNYQCIACTDNSECSRFGSYSCLNGECVYDSGSEAGSGSCLGDNECSGLICYRWW